MTRYWKHVQDGPRERPLEFPDNHVFRTPSSWVEVDGPRAINTTGIKVTPEDNDYRVDFPDGTHDYVSRQYGADDPDLYKKRARAEFAVAAYVREHPPLDEHEVEKLAISVYGAAGWAGSLNEARDVARDVARDLLRDGWSKP